MYLRLSLIEEAVKIYICCLLQLEVACTLSQVPQTSNPRFRLGLAAAEY